MAMAHPQSEAQHHGSAAMEPSTSSSSVSSSVASFLTSASTSSAQTSSTYTPTTPQRPIQTFDAALSHLPAPAKEPAAVSSASVAFASPASAAFTMALAVKKPLDISNLMSPPEPDQLDSFSLNNGSSSRRGSAASASSTASTASTDLLGTASARPGTAIRDLDGRGNPLPGSTPLSPPVSPKDERAASAAADPPLAVAQTAPRDPILYPASTDSSPSSQSRPLFSDAAPFSDNVPVPAKTAVPAPSSAAHVVSGHVAARSPMLFQRATPPRDEDYELALYLQSKLMNSYMVDRRGWLETQRDQLLADRRAAADRNKRLRLVFPPPTRPASSMPAPCHLAPRLLKAAQFVAHGTAMAQHLPPQRTQLPSLHPIHDPSNRVAKRANRAPVTSRSALPTRIALAPHASGDARPVSSSMSKSNSSSNSLLGGSVRARGPYSSPEPRVRTSAPNREDKDFLSLPDYCPPLSTLPERTNNLKVDWKGTPLDLSHDPHLHLLHRDEVGLAASLRLDCATYVTSKRRIFIRRLECARIGKEFRKTDAQQACKIDVNKASKLWTAYEKVGWLRIEHMRRYV